MKIDYDIKQQKFANVYEKALVNIIYTSNALNHFLQKQFKAYGVSMQQYNILRILRGQKGKPASVALLTERMLDKQSNASRLVEKLRVKGLVERFECNEDRRKVNVLITEKGLDLLSKMDKVDSEIINKFSILKSDEAETLSNLLDRIRINL